MFVEEFDYIIEHRSGNRMKHADALSRVSSVNAVTDELVSRLARAQERDEKVAAIKALLQAGEYKDYRLQHGLVYKEVEGQAKLVVPDGLQQEIIRRAHETGHFGVRKTTDLISQDSG